MRDLELGLQLVDTGLGSRRVGVGLGCLLQCGVPRREVRPSLRLPFAFGLGGGRGFPRLVGTHGVGFHRLFRRFLRAFPRRRGFRLARFGHEREAGNLGEALELGLVDQAPGTEQPARVVIRARGAECGSDLTPEGVVRPRAEDRERGVGRRVERRPMRTHRIAHGIGFSGHRPRLCRLQLGAPVEQPFDQLRMASRELIECPRRGARASCPLQLLRGILVSRAAQIGDQPLPAGYELARLDAVELVQGRVE